MVTERFLTRSPLLNLMVRAVLKVTPQILRDFGEVEHLQVSRKGPRDFVTAADRRAERTLQRELEKARPTYGFLMEESGEITGEDPQSRWIIDPIDGTTNFIHGLPHFATTIALEEKGELIAGVTYDPIRDEMFVAQKGFGAYLNGKRLRVSGCATLENALVGCSLSRGKPSSEAAEGSLKPRAFHEGRVAPYVSGIRGCGATSLSLAYMAAGRLDAFWCERNSLWDVAAGMLMIQEAGGTISSMDGKTPALKDGSIFVASPKIRDPLLKILTI